MGSKSFNGEVWTNTHPQVLEAMVQINTQIVDGKVGNDRYTKNAHDLLQKFFTKKIYTMMTFNGTAANILALKSMLHSWSAVVCAGCTHINVYECGALEYMLGNKVLTAESPNGKLTPAMVEDLLEATKNYKYNPEVLVLTQPTELGVLYTCGELKALCDYAHGKGMYVYVDGARLAHATAALNTDLGTMLEQTGVDAFSFGGTKAGAMFGEIVVFLREEFGKQLAYSQKQSLQHMDKSKFLGAQMECLLQNDLWLKTAGHANAMAKLLEQKLAQKGIQPYYPVDTNMVFCRLTPEQFKKVTAVYDLHYWDESLGLVRFATTHETTPQEIENLMALI